MIERDADDVARCFLLERDVASARIPARRCSKGRSSGWSAPARSSRSATGGEFEGLLPVRRLRGDWWELNEQATMLVGTRTAARSGSGTRSRCGSAGSTRRAGRVDLLPGPAEVD